MVGKLGRCFAVWTVLVACAGCAAGGGGSQDRRGVGVEPPLGVVDEEPPPRPKGRASEASTSPEIIRYDKEAVRAAGLSESGPDRSRITPAEPGVRIEEAQDPRIRAILPDARCQKPARTDSAGNAPRCTVSLRRASSAMGADVGGAYAVVSLIDWSTTSWTVPELALIRALQPLTTEKDPSVIAVSDARREVVLTVTGQIFRYDLESGRQLNVYDGPGGRIGALAWSADGARVVVIAGGRAHLLDREMRLVRTLAAEGEAVAIAVSADGKRAAVGTDIGGVFVFGLDGGPPRAVSRSTQAVGALAFTSSALVVAGRDGILRSLDPGSGRELGRADAGAALSRLVVSPDGRRAATMARDFVLRVHALPSGKVTWKTDWHRANFAGLAWGARSTIVAVDNDGELAAWDVAQ
ncbi:MAG TPA: WD40 repeat domain-containing protein [Candidatus Limnocylindrales bacterium]|nr:WD40 repeat domain-containing protein [Candidatus Limnocylindrales bacterium]